MHLFLPTYAYLLQKFASLIKKKKKKIDHSTLYSQLNKQITKESNKQIKKYEFQCDKSIVIVQIPAIMLINEFSRHFNSLSFKKKETKMLVSISLCSPNICIKTYSMLFLANLKVANLCLFCLSIRRFFVYTFTQTKWENMKQ